MMGDFQLRINDTKHDIQLPDDQIARLRRCEFLKESEVILDFLEILMKIFEIKRKSNDSAP